MEIPGRDGVLISPAARYTFPAEPDERPPIAGRVSPDRRTDAVARDYSNYQRKVISRFYENREQIDAQRLSELATDLYLAEGKKRDKLWESAEEAMRRLKVPDSRIAHVLAKKDPALLAEVVNDLQSGRI